MADPFVVITAPPNVVPLIADALGVYQGTVNEPQWGIFLNGVAVIIADTIASHEFKEEFALSDYPTERGGFQTFNKVYIPFDARFRFATGGSEADRQLMLGSVASIIGDLNFYDIVTPLAVYQSANLTHYDYKQTAQNGVGLLVIDVWALEVRQTGGAQPSASQEPAGAAQSNNGGVQPTTPTGPQSSAAADGQLARAAGNSQPSFPGAAFSGGAGGASSFPGSSFGGGVA